MNYKKNKNQTMSKVKINNENNLTLLLDLNY